MYGKKEDWNPEPKDDQTWWKRSHCGAGSIDGSKVCECNSTQEECAKQNTLWILRHHEQACGCSGFWCWKCGTFYPQDSCWEQHDEDFKSLSGKQLSKRDGYMICGCGTKLFKELKEE